MTKRRKPTTKPKILLLCGAIQKTREGLRMTQADFAKQLDASAISLSRWERGEYEPRDPDTLRKLRDMAALVPGLDAEKELFEKYLPRVPFEGIEDKSVEKRIAAVAPDALVLRISNLAEWQLIHALRHANAFLPDARYAVEEALKPALATVKEIIKEQTPADGKLDVAFFNWLSPRMDVLGAQKAFPGTSEVKENE
jgi:transcriptional regulator with XRE-family HTH domain